MKFSSIPVSLQDDGDEVVIDQIHHEDCDDWCTSVTISEVDPAQPDENDVAESGLRVCDVKGAVWVISCRDGSTEFVDTCGGVFEKCVRTEATDIFFVKDVDESDKGSVDESRLDKSVSDAGKKEVRSDSELVMGWDGLFGYEGFGSHLELTDGCGVELSTSEMPVLFGKAVVTQGWDSLLDEAFPWRCKNTHAKAKPVTRREPIHIEIHAITLLLFLDFLSIVFCFSLSSISDSAIIAN